jgi:molecular chaperone DnaJ
MFVMQSSCHQCNGTGEKIKHYCLSCHGSGVEKKKVKEEINIPRGISDGMAIKLSKKGNFDGDLIIKVSVKKSPLFGREGQNAVS